MDKKKACWGMTKLMDTINTLMPFFHVKIVNKRAEMASIYCGLLSLGHKENTVLCAAHRTRYLALW